VRRAGARSAGGLQASPAFYFASSSSHASPPVAPSLTLAALRSRLAHAARLGFRAALQPSLLPAPPARGAPARRRLHVCAAASAKKATKLVFLCTDCGADFPQSHGRCPACKAWETCALARALHDSTHAYRSLKPFNPPDAASGTAGGGAAQRLVSRLPASPAAVKTGAWVSASGAPQPLSAVLRDSASRQLAPGGGLSASQRLSLGSSALGAELARVLGGGLVPGSLTLVGGDPGVGKSTLLLQLLSLVCEAQSSKSPVLYCSAEESVNQVAARAERLGMSAESDGLHLLSCTRVEDVLSALSTLSPAALVVDSIQTVYLDEATGSAGSVSQVRESATALLHAAKRTGCPVFIVGHVTKGGDIAGPKTLEHLVDCVLYMEGEALRELRILRGVKNRHGPSDEVSVFEMAHDGLRVVLNPAAAFLASRTAVPGLASAVAVTLQGARPFLVEVQALCSLPESNESNGESSESNAGGGGGAFRRSATGVKPLRLNRLMAVLAKRCVGSKLFSAETFVNVVGGLELEDPAADLALCVSLAAAFHDAQLPFSTAFVGEIGLGGELRRVPLTERRVLEAARLGFDAVIVPRAGWDDKAEAAGAARPGGCVVSPCGTLEEVLAIVLPHVGGRERKGGGKRRRKGGESEVENEN
jgi:DNA repair protein RadA/Sms